MNRIFLLICIIVLTLFAIVVACVPSEDTTIAKTNIEGYGMKLLTEKDDIQVWRMVDPLSATCYITINSKSYQPAEIFCLK